MHPQHLKDTLSHYNGESSLFFTSLTSFCQLVLEGRVPVEVHPLFFGATLRALKKKSGWERCSWLHRKTSVGKDCRIFGS